MHSWAGFDEKIWFSCGFKERTIENFTSDLPLLTSGTGCWKKPPQIRASLECKVWNFNKECLKDFEVRPTPSLIQNSNRLGTAFYNYQDGTNNLPKLHEKNDFNVVSYGTFTFF